MADNTVLESCMLVGMNQTQNVWWGLGEEYILMRELVISGRLPMSVNCTTYGALQSH